MFNNNRYITRGVNGTLSLYLQTVLWKLIDENIAKKLKMDYLQVFELSSATKDGISCQKIVHSQEVPRRKKIHHIPADTERISCKVFVIDSDDYVTMLLPEEY